MSSTNSENSQRLFDTNDPLNMRLIKPSANAVYKITKLRCTYRDIAKELFQYLADNRETDQAQLSLEQSLMWAVKSLCISSLSEADGNTANEADSKAAEADKVTNKPAETPAASEEKKDEDHFLCVINSHRHVLNKNHPLITEGHAIPYDTSTVKDPLIAYDTIIKMANHFCDPTAKITCPMVRITYPNSPIAYLKSGFIMRPDDSTRAEGMHANVVQVPVPKSGTDVSICINMKKHLLNIWHDSIGSDGKISYHQIVARSEVKENFPPVYVCYPSETTHWLQTGFWIRAGDSVQLTGLNAVVGNCSDASVMNTELLSVHVNNVKHLIPDRKYPSPHIRLGMSYEELVELSGIKGSPIVEVSYPYESLPSRRYGWILTPGEVAPLHSGLHAKVSKDVTFNVFLNGRRWIATLKDPKLMRGTVSYEYLVQMADMKGNPTVTVYRPAHTTANGKQENFTMIQNDITSLTDGMIVSITNSMPF